MSNFCGRRFLSVLVGALTVLGSHVASAFDETKKDGVIVSKKRVAKRYGRKSAVGNSHKRRGKKVVIGKKGKADTKKRDKKLKRPRKIRGIKWNKIWKLVKTPLGAAVGVGSVATLGVASYCGARWLFGGKVVPKKDVPKKDVPKKVVPKKAVSEVPSFFSNLSDKKNKFMYAIKSFGLGFDVKLFKDAVEKLSYEGDGLYNFGWGKFRATENDGFVCAVDKGGLESHAELIIDGVKADMSYLSSKVLDLLLENVSVTEMEDVLACLFTVCWVYAKYDGIFAFSATDGFYPDVKKFSDVVFRSEIVNAYNEINKWVKSCRKEKV